jgi:hypothetical protein
LSGTGQKRRSNSGKAWWWFKVTHFWGIAAALTNDNNSIEKAIRVKFTLAKQISTFGGWTPLYFC